MEKLTVEDLALHFNMSRIEMELLLQKSQTDLTDAASVLAFVTDLSHDLCLDSGRSVIGDLD